MDQDGPKMAQDVSKMAQDGLNMAQDGLRMAKDSPKMAKDGPKMAQDGFKMAQDGLRYTQNNPKHPQYGSICPQQPRDYTRISPRHCMFFGHVSALYTSTLSQQEHRQNKHAINGLRRQVVAHIPRQLRYHDKVLV